MHCCEHTDDCNISISRSCKQHDVSRPEQLFVYDVAYLHRLLCIEAKKMQSMSRLQEIPCQVQ